MARTSAASAQVTPVQGAPVRRSSFIDYIDPRNIAILPQVRPDGEYDDIDLLTDSIADMGLLENPVVAMLDAKHIRPYLKFFSVAFDKKLTMRHVVVDHQSGCYYVVVFGHRRTLALRRLYEHGCSQCESAEQCRQRHLARHGLDLGAEVKVRVNLDPETAYRIQDAENTKLDVSRHAQVQRLRNGWLIAKRLNPQITKADYARGMNRKAEEIYDAIRYCELPSMVHESVRQNTTPYTVAVQLTRMQAAGFDDTAICQAMQFIRTENMTAAQAARYITGRIKARDEAPIEADELFVVEQVDAERDWNAKLRRSVADQAYRTFAAEAAAFGATRRAVETGVVPRIDVTRSDRVRNAVQRGEQARQDLLKV